MTPQAERPGIRGYGIAEDAEGMLPWSFVSERMTQARNYWIATTRPDGRPHAMPVWGVWVDDTFYFGTSPTSVKARNLDANPAVSVHLESGDECVILEGEIEKLRGEDPALWQRIGDEYARKYAGYRPESETADGFNELRPRVAFAWLEADYPKTATRFVLGDDR